MFVNASPQVAQINVPIAVVRTVQENDYGVERGEIIPPSHLHLIKVASDLLDFSILPVVKEMTQKEAQQVLEEVKPTLHSFLELTEGLEESDSLDENFIAFKNMVQKMIVVLNEIIFISNNREIDEDSEGYNEFMYSLVMKAIEEGGRRPVSREELLAVFD